MWLYPICLYTYIHRAGSNALYQKIQEETKKKMVAMRKNKPIDIGCCVYAKAGDWYGNGSQKGGEAGCARPVRHRHLLLTSRGYPGSSSL